MKNTEIKEKLQQLHNTASDLISELSSDLDDIHRVYDNTNQELKVTQDKLNDMFWAGFLGFAIKLAMMDFNTGKLLAYDVLESDLCDFDLEFYQRLGLSRSDIAVLRKIYAVDEEYD